MAVRGIRLYFRCKYFSYSIDNSDFPVLTVNQSYLVTVHARLHSLRPCLDRYSFFRTGVIILMTKETALVNNDSITESEILISMLLVIMGGYWSNSSVLTDISCSL